MHQKSFASILLVFFLATQMLQSVFAQSFEPVTALLDPTAFGVEAGAVEVPERRTEKTVTFRLPRGSFTAVSSGNEIFTHDAHGILVPISEVGKQTPEGILFDRLSRDASVLFDLSSPSYTYKNNDHFFRLSFVGNATATLEKDNVVAYQLSKHATLRFTIKGATIHKAITIDGPVDPELLHFTLSNDTSLIQRSSSGGLNFDTVDGTSIFRSAAPSLLDASGNTLDHPITIISLGNGTYAYDYDPTGLPSIYIIDPSTCALFPPAIFETDMCEGCPDFTPWTNLQGARVLDGDYAVSANPGNSVYTYGLIGSNFGFHIPYGRIDGVTVDIWRYTTADENSEFGPASANDLTVKLIVNGYFAGTNMADLSNPWPTNLQQKTYGGGGALWGLTDPLTSAQVNEEGTGIGGAGRFGVVANVSCVAQAPSCGSQYVDAIRMQINYSQQCETSTGGTLTSSVPICIKQQAAQDGFSYPLTGTGIPLCADTGCYLILSKVGTTGFGTGVHAYQEEFNGSANSDVTLIDNLELTQYPSLIHFVKDASNGIFQKIADARIQFQPMCDSSKIYADLDPEPASDSGSEQSVFHFVSESNGYYGPSLGGAVWGGTGYTLFVKKSTYHNQVLLCAGKKDLGCVLGETWGPPPPSNSWSFYANDMGQITAQGNFDASANRVTIGYEAYPFAANYWKITGLSATGGEGGIEEGGGHPVPEFSKIGFAFLLVGCGFFLRKILKKQ